MEGRSTHAGIKTGQEAVNSIFKEKEAAKARRHPTLDSAMGL
jgi:hypothetical protein